MTDYVPDVLDDESIIQQHKYTEIEKNRINEIHSKLIEFLETGNVDDCWLKRLTSPLIGAYLISSGDYIKKYISLRKIGYILPSNQLINSCLSLDSPILSVGCGFGYIEALLKKFGANIIATDLYPSNENLKIHSITGIYSNCTSGLSGYSYMNIEKIDAIKASKKYKNYILLAIRPSHNMDWPLNLLKSLEQNREILYLDTEGTRCNINEYIKSSYQTISTEILPNWFGDQLLLQHLKKL